MNGDNNIAEVPIGPIHYHDGGTSANVILRSTDNVDFPTSKVLLSMTAEYFRTKLSIPQPSAESSGEGGQEFVNGVPVILIEADASLLRNLLLFCNPGKTPEMSQLEGVQKLATKYQMYEVAKRILRERTWGKLNSPHNARCYRENLRAEQQCVPRCKVFMMSFPEDGLEDVAELELITKEQFDSLLAYRSRCIEAAHEIASPPHTHYTWMSEIWTTTSWFSSDGGNHDRSCQLGGHIYTGDVTGKWVKRYWWMERYWWRTYIYAASNELKKRPCGSVVQCEEIFEQAMIDGSQCAKCRPDVESRFREFAALFASQVDKAVSSVRYFGCEHEYCLLTMLRYGQVPLELNPA